MEIFFFRNSTLMQHGHGFPGKRDIKRGFSGLNLIHNQFIKPLPKFVEHIKQKDHLNDLSVLTGKGLNGSPSFIFQTLDSCINLFNAAVGTLPSGNFWKKSRNFSVKPFSQLAKGVGKGGIIYSFEKGSFIRV